MYAISNRTDCARYECEEMPWHWASYWVLENVPLSRDSIIADLGAGKNPIIDDALSKVGATAVLVDQMVLTTPTSSRWVLAADMSELPLADESVDSVVSVSSLEHLSPRKQAKTIQEIWRVLKPDGVAAVTFGCLFNANVDAQELLRTLPFFVDRGCPVYVPLNIRCAVEGSGFNSENLPETVTEEILTWPDLVTEQWDGYEQLKPYPQLRAISHCEIGIRLVK